MSDNFECGFLFILTNNFKSRKMEFQGRYFFFCVIMQYFTALLSYFCEFINKDSSLRLLFVRKMVISKFRKFFLLFKALRNAKLFVRSTNVDLLIAKWYT